MIQSRTYEKDDKKVYTTEIVADKITFLSTNKKEEPKQDPLDKAVDEFSNEADLSDIGIAEDGLPF